MRAFIIDLIARIPFIPARLKHYFCLRLKYLTLKKLINFIKIEYCFWRKKAILSGYPYELIIESTNVCQLKCPFCYASKIESKQEKGFISFALFRSVIDELSPTALHVFLHLRGEPFLHKEMCKLVNYAHDANLGTTISTNFSMPLDEKQIEGIIDSGLDTLVISADGITPEIYEQYRIGGDFNQVIANIKLLVRKKKEKRSLAPYVEWQILVMKHNEHQLEEAKIFIKGLGVDSIAFGQVNVPQGEEMWLPDNKQYRGGRLLDKPDSLINKCWWLWRAAIIHWDGVIAPCCFIYDKTKQFAVFSRPFSEIWNNPSYVAARNLFSHNNIEQSVQTACHSCNVTNHKINGKS